MLTAFILPNFTISGPLGALIAVIALAFVNTHLWDAALFFSIPSSFTTQAILLLLANGVIFWILVKILPGIEVQGFLPALAAPVVFTVTSVILQNYLKDVDWSKVWHQSVNYVQGVREDFKASVPTPITRRN